MTVHATAIDACRLRRLYGSSTIIARLYSELQRVELESFLLLRCQTRDLAERAIALSQGSLAQSRSRPAWGLCMRLHALPQKRLTAPHRHTLPLPVYLSFSQMTSTVLALTHGVSFFAGTTDASVFCPRLPRCRCGCYISTDFAS